MSKVTFTLQVVTPLFLAGTNQREVEIPQNSCKEHEKTTAWALVPELRSPSFRGLMRYWLRAAAAGLEGTRPLPLEDIRDLEQSIFGSTEQGSTVQVRVNTISQAELPFRKEGRSPNQIIGKDYLYWSMDRSGKGNNYKPERSFLTQDTSLSITLFVHGQDDLHKRQLECATASLWLLLTLGALGSRSRKCAGSFTVTSVSNNTTKLSFTEAANVPELQKRLSEGIREVRGIYASQLAEIKPKRAAPLNEKAFDSLIVPSYCRIWILQRRIGGKVSPWSHVNDALSDIGKAWQGFHRSIQPLEKRATLGLPLIFQQPLKDQRLMKALKDERRASPLLFKVCKLRGEQYVGIAVLFKTRYGAIDHIIPAPDYTIIEEWMKGKLASMDAVEVTL